LKRKYWPHQLDSFRYAMEFRHPALFLQMRLGKTMVSVRRINLYKPLDPKLGLRILIVAPSSALGSWIDELQEEGESSVQLLIAAKKKRRGFLMQRRKWNLINKEGYQALPQIANIDWDCVVLDESTFIKTVWKIKVTEFFLDNFRDVPHRWILTGTPNPESDLEFWSQLAFLDGQAFGCKTFWQFRVKYFQPDENGYNWVAKRGTAKMIQQYVGRRCKIIRRKDVNMDKEKIKMKRTFDLPDKLRIQYERIEEDFEYETDEIVTTKFSITKHQWLRRFCGGFLDGELVWKGKIDCLVDLLKNELRRDSVIVWAWYKDEIAAIYKALKKKKINCAVMQGGGGGNKLEIRERKKKLFNKGKIQVLIIQPEVAKTGMNLSKADTAIYYSEPEGLEASQQTEDRILSLAKTSPLLYIYLQVKDSVDQDIRDALSMKALKSDYQLNRAIKESMRRRIEWRKRKRCSN